MVCKVEKKQQSSFEGSSKPSELLLSLLYHSVFSSVCFLSLYFLSFFPLDEDHAVSFYLPLNILKQQEFRSQDHLWQFRWKQQGCLRELGVFLPTHCHTCSTTCEVPGLVADLGLAAKRSSSPSLSLNLGQLGRKLSLLETKERSLLETKENNTWRGAQGSPGAQLKHRAPAAQAPSHTQPVLDKTLKKWEFLCSCLLQPYPGSQRSVEDVGQLQGN